MQKVIVVLISILLLISVNLYAQAGDLIESGDAGGVTNIPLPAGEGIPEDLNPHIARERKP